MVYVQGEEEKERKRIEEELNKDKIWDETKTLVNASAISKVVGNALRSGRLSILKASPSFPVNVQRKYANRVLFLTKKSILTFLVHRKNRISLSKQTKKNNV